MPKAIAEQAANREDCRHSLLMKELRSWYGTPLGALLQQALQSRCDELLVGSSGFHALQIGDLGEGFDPLRRSGHYHQVLLDCSSPRAQLHAYDELLPLESGSLDLLILVHSLDFCADPHAVLREAERVLEDDGQLLLIGFNPFSLSGLFRFLLRWRQWVPWRGHFYSMRRVGDWLSLLQFTVLHRRSVLLRPPLRRAGLLKLFSPLENLLPLLPTLGGVYLLMACKRRVPMTFIRPRWAPSRRLVAGGLAETTHRSGGRV